jgi:hypothetical protein
MLRTGQNADCQVGHGGQCEQQIQADINYLAQEVFEEVQKLIEYGDMEV